MATLEELALLAEDPNFKKKVKFAMVRQALNVQAEDAGVANHAQRSAFANRAITNPDTYTEAMTIAVIATNTIDPESAITNLITACGTVWNAFSLGGA
jgi:hypothetical protein